MKNYFDANQHAGKFDESISNFSDQKEKELPSWHSYGYWKTCADMACKVDKVNDKCDCSSSEKVQTSKAE